MSLAIYYPIFRLKLGETEAVAHLSPRAKRRTRPTFDCTLPKEGEDLASFLSTMVQEVAKTWGTEFPLGIDFSRYDPEIVTREKQLAVTHAFECARQKKLKAIPVVGPLYLRGPGSAYVNAVRDIVSKDKRGVIIRMPHEVFASPTVLLKELDEVLLALSLVDQEADLYLDAGPLSILPGQAQTEAALLATFGAAISAVESRSVRRLVMLASSIPDVIPRREDSVPHRVTRTELAVWRAESKATKQSIYFGDYGARFAHQTDPDGAVIPPGRVHVGTEDAYYLYRVDPSDQRELCRRVAESPEFYAQEDGWGKEAIRDAAGRGGVGAAREWVARDTNVLIETTVSHLERHLRGVGKLVELPTQQGVAPWLQERMSDIDPRS